MSSSSPESVVRAMHEAECHDVDRSRGATLQVLLGPEDGTPTFATRRFTLEPGGRIPSHRHASIEHEQVVLEGEMVIGLDDQVHTVAPGMCLFIPAGVAHWYENRGDTAVVFLCMVPLTETYETEWLEPAEKS